MHVGMRVRCACTCMHAQLAAGAGDQSIASLRPPFPGRAQSITSTSTWLYISQINKIYYNRLLALGSYSLGLSMETRTRARQQASVSLYALFETWRAEIREARSSGQPVCSQQGLRENLRQEFAVCAGARRTSGIVTGEYSCIPLVQKMLYSN